MNVASTNEGTLNLVVFFPLWPVERNQIIREHQLSNGRVTLWATETGKLLAELVFEHDALVHPNDRAWSCPIEAEPGAGMIIFVTWKSKRFIQLHINSHTAFSLETPAEVPPKIILAKNAGARAPQDFNSANEKARIDRANAIRGRGGDTNSKRIDGGEAYAFQALKDEAEQLRDLMSHVEQGKEYHVPGLGSRIRLLVADKPMGLLQTCAGYQQSPLLLYTVANPNTPRPALSVSPDLWLRMSGSAMSTGSFSNPIDLDLWLPHWTMFARGRNYTNLEVIREIGDTIGSHRDIGITQAISALMRRPSLSGSRYNDVTQYSLMFGQICLTLADTLLSDRT